MAVIAGAGCASRNASASGGQVSDSSLIFSNLGTDFAAGSYLTKTPSSTGNTRQWTWSAWVKRCGLYSNGNNIFAAYVDDNNRDTIRFGGLSADCFEYQNYDGGNGYGNRTNSVYRDTIGWYHVVIAYDSTLGSNRVKYYINGTQITWLTNQGSGAVTSEQKSHINTTGAHYIGARKDSSGVEGNFDGMISQAYFIDGQALEATEFGYTDPLTNTWRLKKFIAPYKPNKGQDWAGMCAGGTDGGYGHEKAFDGSDATSCYPSPGSTVTMTIPAGNLQYTTSFEMWVSRDVNGGVITVNGGSDVNVSGSGFQIVDLSGQVAAGADITEITWARAGSGSIGVMVYYIMIDGVALMDDDLTNMGVNGFHLPMDGNSPAGQDTSGRGNDWTRVSIGGLTPLDKATGALPILNTVNGGNVSSPGVRTDTFGNSCVLALPLVGIVTDVSNQINSGSTTKVVTTNGDPSASFVQSNFYGGSFDFDATGDYFNTTTSSTDFNFGTGDFTIEAWCYVDSGADNKGLWQLSTTSGGLEVSSTTLSCNYESDEFYFGSAGGWRNSGGTHADARWHHVAEVRNSGTIYIYVDGVLDQSWSDTNTYDMTYWAVGGYYSTSYLWSGYIQDFRVYKGVAKYTKDFIVGSSSPDIVQDTPAGVSQSSQLTKATSNSVSFAGDADYLLIETNSDLALGTDDFTIEFWVFMSTDQYTIFFDMRPNSAASQGLYPTIYLNSGTSLRYYTDSADRITGDDMVARKWYHVAVARSSTSTKMFLNGIQQGATYSDSNNYLNGDTTIGCRADGSTGDLVGYMSNVRVVKGTAVYTANFAPPTSPLTNITNTKLLCCNKSSATGSTVTPDTITANGTVASVKSNPFDTDIDVALGKSTGYCTLNPLKYGGTVEGAYNGNLEVRSAASGYGGILCTQGMSSGKWYFEFVSTSGYGAIGIAKQDVDVTTYLGISSLAYIYLTNGNKANNNSYVSYGPTWTTEDVMGVSFDADNGILTYYKNGISLGSAYTGLTSGPYYPAFSDDFGSSRGDGLFNFGQKPFSFNPPDGYEPLCLANTQRPGNARPDQFYDTILYTGSGNNTVNTISDFNFQPDLLIFKQKDATQNWPWYDSVRGTSLAIRSNNTAAEAAFGDAVVTPQKSGFTITGSNTAGINGSSENMIVYGFKAGGNSNTFNIDDVGYSSAAAAGMDGGDINPTGCSINTQTGFSILKYTGNQGTAQTLNHGLGEIPDFVVCKNLGTTYNWFIWHESFGNGADAAIYFTNAAKTTGYVTQPFGTFTTSSLTFNYNDGVNGAYDYICYAWKNVPGVQKFGSYSANNNADGPYVELGFKPALVCIKSSSTGGTARNWALVDSTRSYANVANHTLAWNLDNPASDYGGGESVFGASNKIDLLSNGFKIRDTGNWCNESGATYIYMAWAESPFHNLYGGEANAR